MKKLIYSAFMILFIGVGCTNLDEEIYDNIPADQYPENAAQIAGLAVDGYTKLQDLIDDGGWWYLTQEVTSDEIVFPTRDTDWDDGGKWRVMHSHEWSNDVDAVNSMWSNLFDGITRCNNILDRFSTFTQTDDTRKKIAEIETMRTFYYYLLMDNYGAVPYITSSVDAPEQPYKLNRTALFDSLVTNLEKNIPLLLDGDKKYLANKYMANALLAKLYLNAEVYTGTPQWEKAGEAIDVVLNGPYSLDTDVSGPFKTDNENNSEIIFSIAFDEDNNQGFRIHMRTLHYKHNLTFDMPVGPWNGGGATKLQFDRYADNDLRKDVFLIYGPQYDASGQPLMDDERHVVIDPEIPSLWIQADRSYEEIKYSAARIGKFEIKKGAKENLSNDFPLFRLTDFMLMKAEVEIRMGRNGDEWVNPIRERAEVDPFTNATLEQLLEERAREMFAEGHRRQDQIRFGTWNKAWWEKDATSGKDTFPIPKWASDANPNLLENPK
jgi:hypothetical protein